MPQAIGDGEGVVETYTIDHSGKAPLGVVVGRLKESQARFVSMTRPGDDSVVQTMIEADPLGARVEVKPDESGRSIIRAITPARLRSLLSPRSPGWSRRRASAPVALQTIEGASR